MDENENGSKESAKVVLYYSLPLRKLASTVVSLPLTALVVCFISAVLFQFDDVHETHCKVYNIVPSISAVTGISPQRYLWRTFIALHLAPRYLIAIVYNAQMSSALSKHKTLVSLSFWLSVIEVSALAGTTYISNLDNFPLHENLFIVFMICSLLYMLVMLRVYRLAYPSMTSAQTYSFYTKLVLFVTSILATIGLVVFWFKHRRHCLDMAFSWFAICEYVIALSNMAYHMTVALDFPSEHLLIANGFSSSFLTSNHISQHVKHD
ncbi:hypothetical protein M8J76_003392 [Diaphorina citri]|nr:hypothetical protein M8J76_003392 [Diaphorina citri]